jgi:preprotein translocase subunit SecD
MSKVKAFFIIFISILSCYIALPTVFPNLSSFIPQALRANPVNLGLDLKGGASILMEVDIDSYLKDLYQKSLNDIMQKLRSNGIEYKEIHVDIDGFSICCDQDIKNTSRNILSVANEIMGSDFDHSIENETLKIKMKPQFIADVKNKLMEQSINIINTETTTY